MLLSLLFSQPLLFVAVLLAIIVALTFHEYSHAFTAKMLGDDTAERFGRLTLNPLKHIDPVGFLMLLVAGFGYARPVPYDPRALKNPRSGAVQIGIAGPISNIIMAVIAALVLKMVSDLGSDNLLIQFLIFSAIININLAVFNLLPIPPLDGSNILLSLLRGPRFVRTRNMILQRGPLILLALILIDTFGGFGIFSSIFSFFSNGFFHIMGIDLTV
ncbi:MAG: site-2 protease family protein [Patescibacteria group bacterium]